MFRDSFRESNRNGHILYYDTEDILNALGSENVIKIIKKESESLVITGLTIPRDYQKQMEVGL